MNKEIRIKTLEELINQPREIKFDTYKFDELSYTCLLCDIRMIILENQKYKEVIDKLRDLIKNRHTNSKVYWFDKEYAKDYGELCTSAGAGDTRTVVILLTDLSNILKEVE